ncbi:hypothetical protein AYL99_07114 [Fonsecaea erecta]|uniref:Uncharacterized protein n=1 Tax=Fonsecaea erecta TaxID=1367422 RepID=A0A178ZDZ0_9EURO|nr:hypothetical protein AYL99_07114 [Fonsecaea erecta]OAP58024.1 hypothetical protein AYL99_07114 [Fonsecaea erecta]
MPGQWVLDDSQSLYYSDSGERPEEVSTKRLPRRLSGQENAPFRRRPDRPSNTYRQHMPIRHQTPTLDRKSTTTVSSTAPPSFKRPRLSSEGDLLGHPLVLGQAPDAAPPVDLDLDLYQDVQTTPTTTASAMAASSVFAPTLPPVLEVSRHRRDECDKSQKEAGHAITRVLARLDRALLLDHTFTHPLSSLNLVMGFNTSLPRSRLDTYITALRQLLRCSSEQCFLSNELQRAITAEGVLWVVREAWPAAEGYWNLTATFRGFLHAELWRNFPSQRSYSQLPPAYRPTRAQLSVPHSPMIDWMPWPDVRDMAIKYQDQIDVDALFRMAIHNVVAHRKRRGGRGRGRNLSLPTTASSLSSSAFAKEAYHDDYAGPDLLETTTSTPPLTHVNQAQGGDDDDASDKTSFRVWDLVCLEKAHETPPTPTPTPTLTPASTLQAEPGLSKKPVLRSPGVRALLRAYDLEYDEFDTQKLDDRFFEAYPCLYADSAASTWTVKSFPNLPREDVGRPVALTRPAVARLKDRLENMIGARIEI